MINEIERLKLKLAAYTKQYNEIILSIKQVCYNKPWGSDDSKLRPEREGDIMKAAFFVRIELSQIDMTQIITLDSQKNLSLMSLKIIGFFIQKNLIEMVIKHLQ